MTRPLLLLFLFALSFAMPRPAAAEIQPRLSLADLGTRAALAVRGRVVEARGAWVAAERTIYTYVTIDVLETVKGRPAGRLVLKQLGGVTPTLGLHVDGQAAFAPGEDLLLFLEVSPRDGTLHTVALRQGKWAVLTDLASGRTTALRDGAAAGETAVPLEEVRAATLASGDPALYLAAPPEAAAIRADGLTAGDYAYLPTGGDPARWHEVDDGATIPVDTGSLAGLGGGLTQVDAAIALWSGAGSSLRLSRSGSFSGCAAEFTGDGRIRVGSDAQCQQASGWVLAGGYFTPGDLRVVGGVTFQKFVQAFAVINDAGPQVSSAGCFQDAVTHGLGHAIGLGHTGGDSIMNADPPSGCASGPRGLGSDDVSGARDIYRAQPDSGQVPNAPTAVTTAVAGSTVTITWTPATTGGIPQSYLIEAGTDQGLANVGVIPTTGAGTSLVVNDVPQGVYWVRVRARNALGTSASASPDAQVVMGTCEAPGVPLSFTATGNDTLASFTWAPPASGGAVTRYQLEAGSVPGLANVLVHGLPAAPTSFQARGPHGTYYVRLRAGNSCGVSAPTGDIALVLQPCSAPPSAPTNLQFTVSPQRVVTLTWTPAAGGATPGDYVVYVGSQPGGSDILVYGTGSTAPSLVASAPPRTYFVRVAARNACGQSSTTTNEQAIVVP